MPKEVEKSLGSLFDWAVLRPFADYETDLCFGALIQLKK